jgi:cystathionine gamma-lyase
MERHCGNAMPIAAFLAKHPTVAKVIYPGLATHPQHLLAAKQMSQRYDGMVTAVLKGGLPASKRFIVRLSVGFESIDDLLAELKEGLS